MLFCFPVKYHFLGLHPLKPALALAATDFNHSAELLESGYNLTLDYLNNLPLPLKARLNQAWHKFKAQLTSPQSRGAGEKVSRWKSDKHRSPAHLPTNSPAHLPAGSPASSSPEASASSETSETSETAASSPITN